MDSYNLASSIEFKFYIYIHIYVLTGNISENICILTHFYLFKVSLWTGKKTSRGRRVILQE